MAQLGTDQETKRKKEERAWADIDEGLKFVNEKGKVMCKYCSKPEAKLKVTSNDISLQDVPYMTNSDKDGKVNFLFEGTCNYPSQQKPFSPPPPCKAVINLGEWKNYAEVHIDNDYALIVDSTIPCMISQEDLIVVHSGQMAEVTELDPLSNLRIRVEVSFLEVCTEARVRAIYQKAGEEVENENIKWEVEVFSNKKVKDENGREREVSKIYNLEDVKLENSTLGKLEGKPLCENNTDEEIGSDSIFKTKGNNICFNVPKEWGQKQVRFIATVEEEGLAVISKRRLYVKDHIVAAFYRIDTNTPKTNVIKEIKGSEKNYKNLIGPVHHHQGMYKAANRFFVSGSTHRDVPSYTYVIEQNEDGSHTHRNSILFDGGVLKYYRHAGGMQVANGLMAVGIEEYNYKLVDIEKPKDIINKSKWGVFGSSVHNRSVICFFHVKNGKEIKELRIINDTKYKKKINELTQEYRDREKKQKEDVQDLLKQLEEDKLCIYNEVNSLSIKDDYASAVGIIYEERLKKYYVVSRGGNQGVSFFEISSDRKTIKAIKSEEKDKESFVGEFQNVNLHQDEWGGIYMFGMGKSQMGGVDTCKIYQVNILEESAMISSVWINESGEIKSTYYRFENEKNKLVFNCSNGTSFHWASCIHMENSNLIGNKKGFSTDLVGQNFEQGFQGKFTVYTVNQETLYYHTRENLARRDYYREGSPGNFYTYKQQEKYRIELEPQFRCYHFNEDKEDEDTM